MCQNKASQPMLQQCDECGTKFEVVYHYPNGGITFLNENAVCDCPASYSTCEGYPPVGEWLELIKMDFDDARKWIEKNVIVKGEAKGDIKKFLLSVDVDLKDKLIMYFASKLKMQLDLQT